MKRFLLDTDSCIFYLRNRFNVGRRLRSVGAQYCHISIITLVELRYGAECSDRTDQRHKEVDEFCGLISMIPIDEVIVDRFVKEKAALRKAGSLIPDFDLLIGSTAIRHGLTIVTNNTKHFGRLPSLEIENWTQ